MNKLVKRLNALPEGLLANAKAAALAAAEQAAASARANAPVDTGKLRESISFSKTHSGAVTTASAQHAPMVEFGTVKMPPQPFMLPAAQSVRNSFLRDAEIRLHSILQNGR